MLQRHGLVSSSLDNSYVFLSFRLYITYLFVIPVLRFVPVPVSEMPEPCAFSYLELKPFLLLVEDDPPPADFLYPLPAPFFPAGFFASRRKLEKSNLFSSSSS